MKEIIETLKRRILILDGAMGTMIQKYGLSEKDYRSVRFEGWHLDIKGNNDILSITQPDIIAAIHKEYIAAGADIIETNTFSAQRISMADYQMEEFVREINLESARIAKRQASEANRKVWVAGAVGPMNRTLSLSPDVNDPSFRAMTFDQAMSAYKEQIIALIEGGVDLILLETIFDTLNAKAAIVALKHIFRERSDYQRPIMISGTIVDQSGRTLSGQTPQAFFISIEHAKPLSVGLNCSLGANLMTPYIEEIARQKSVFVSAYPNAGLPNAMGEYDETPDQMAAQIKEWLEGKLVNIVGGCCGTTPDHIRALKDLASAYSPRDVSI